jgi:hypothetical protein
MSHDIITLNPAEAGITLLDMQELLEKFNDKLYETGSAIEFTTTITYSDPLIKALGRSVHELTDLGRGVNTAIYAFSHAFVQVIEQWRKTDAKSAAGVFFRKPHPVEFHVLQRSAEKLLVRVDKIDFLIERIYLSGRSMGIYFDQMDNLIKESARYWRGHSADQTRHNWKRYLEPLMDRADATIEKVCDTMREELREFMKRDARNFPGAF